MEKYICKDCGDKDCGDTTYCSKCMVENEAMMKLDQCYIDLLFKHICQIYSSDLKTKRIYEMTHKNFDIKKHITSNTILEYLRTSDIFKPLIRFYKKLSLLNTIKPYHEKNYGHILDDIKNDMSDYHMFSYGCQKPWFLCRETDDFYIESDSEQDSDQEETNQIKHLQKRKEYNIINKCISAIKNDINDNSELFMKTHFGRKSSDAYKKLINDYLYFVNGFIVSEILSLEEKYMGLDPKLFKINKNDAVKTYFNILEYLDNPDTFKCGICLEKFSYSTTIDYCCMKNYCRDCMRLQIITKKECAICHLPIIKYPKKKDVIYFAGSMKIDRPLIKYNFADNSDTFNYRCECCMGCPICHNTMGYCDCKLNDKKVLEYNRKIDLSSHENEMEVNNDGRIYNLIGPILFINGSNIEKCSHSCSSPCVPPYFGLSLINNYHNSIKLSDVLILTVDPIHLDSYASYAEWGMACKKTLYIIPKYGKKLPADLWWFAMESILSINKLKDEKRIDYHMIILNSINPEIRSKKIYHHMLDQTTKHKDYNTNNTSRVSKEKEWSIMNIHEKNACISIGYTKETWSDPDLLEEKDDPLNKPWVAFTEEQKESLHYLGFTEKDFD